MTPEMKQHLETVITATIQSDADAAKSALSQYLHLKTREVVQQSVAPAPAAAPEPSPSE